MPRELAAWVHGTDELPLRALLASVGVGVAATKPPRLAAALGAARGEGRGDRRAGDDVLRGGAAERAGVAAGDELLAVDGWRMRRLDDALQWLGAAARPFELLLVRDQRAAARCAWCPSRLAAAPARALASTRRAAGARRSALRRAWSAAG